MFYRIRKFLKLSFDRSFSGSWFRQVLWLSAVILCAFLLLDVYNRYFAYPPIEHGILMKLFIDPGTFEPNKMSYFHLFATIVGAILFSGMLISVISNILERRIERYQKGEIHYHFIDHILILGYDDMISNLIQQLCKSPDYKSCDIVILSSKDTEKLREEISTELTNKEFLHITFIHACITSFEDLKKVHVDSTREVFVFGEKNSKEHDSACISSLKNIAKICQERNRKDKLKCNVMLSYQTSYAVFQLSDISQSIKEQIDFYPFNLNELWTQRVLVHGVKHWGEKRYYEPLDREGIDSQSDKHVHLVIVGMTAMGVSMAVTAAHIAHYPNFKTKKIRTKITFIDTNVKKEMKFFQARYNHLFSLIHSRLITVDEVNDTVTSVSDMPSPALDFLDIEWEFIQTSIESTYARRKIVDWTDDKNKLLTIAICFNTPPHSIAAGLYLPNEIYEKCIPVLIHQKKSDSIIEIAKTSHKYKSVCAFGMINCGYELEESDINLAKQVNYLYAYYFGEGNGSLPEMRPSDNTVNEAWRKKTIVEQWSNVYNANMLYTKLRSIHKESDAIKGKLELSDDEVNTLAVVEHNRWNTERLLLGTRPFKDLNERMEFMKLSKEEQRNKKQKELVHPDIVPYDDLPDSSKNIDKQLTKGLETLTRLLYADKK